MPASTASASSAAAQHPASTRAQFCVCRPAKIKSPRLGWPTVVDSVAAPIVHTAAVRRPATATGAASGASTSRSFLAGGHTDGIRRLDHRRVDAVQAGDAVCAAAVTAHRA